MDINKNTNVADVTMAEIQVVLSDTEAQFNCAVKNMDLKQAVGLAKRYIELSKLMHKRSIYAIKNNINVGADQMEEFKMDMVQKEVALEVEKIMNEEESKGHSK